MNRNTYRTPSSRPGCRKCRLQQRLSARNLSAPFASGCDSRTKLQVVSAMYEYIIKSWDELPDRNKKALGFDLVVGSEGEEAALNYMARLFIEYAQLSFGRALVARRRRLPLDGVPGQCREAAVSRLD